MKCHYVPQFYLRNFSIPGKERLLYSYQRNKGPIITGTKGIAAENDLYIFTDKNTGEKSDEIEKMFAWLESLASPIIKKIINGSALVDLSNEEHNVLSEFVAYLHVRNLSQRQKQKNMFKELLKIQLKSTTLNKQVFKKILKEATDKIDTDNEEEIEELRKGILDFDNRFTIEVGNNNDDYFLKQSLQLGLEISPVLFHKEWHILDSQKVSRVFITSDNPVVVIKPENWGRFRGVGIANGYVALPLSPTKCLWIVNGEAEPTIIDADRKMVDLINHHIMFFAHKSIYSHILAKDFVNDFNKTKDGGSEKLVVSGALFS